MMGASFACSSDSSGGDSDPVFTRAIPTPPVSAEAPTPAPPGLDARLRELGSGTTNIRVLPRSYHEFDTLLYARDRGIQTPPCASFVMAFTWEIVEPYPPAGLEVVITGSRMGGTTNLGRGASGESAVGCAEMRIANSSTNEITVTLRYTFAAVIE